MAYFKSKSEAQQYSKLLKKAGYTVGAIEGDRGGGVGYYKRDASYRFDTDAPGDALLLVAALTGTGTYWHKTADATEWEWISRQYPEVYERFVSAGLVKGGKVAKNPSGSRYRKNPKQPKPYAVIGIWEYWLVGDQVYRSQVGNRGPMEAGKPSNARWESEKWHFDHFRGMLEMEAKKESNPDDGGEAAEVFEEFHGYPSSGTTSLAEQEQYRDELAQLGTLEELEVCIDGTDKVVPISFDHHTKLCVTTDKKQMYLLGGNQELDLDELVEAGALDESEKEKDFVAIGPVHSITYFARKQHLSGPKNGVPYIHEFGEEDGVYPELVYDRLNKTCSLVGGSYTVEDVGIKN